MSGFDEGSVDRGNSSPVARSNKNLSVPFGYGDRAGRLSVCRVRMSTRLLVRVTGGRGADPHAGKYWGKIPPMSTPAEQNMKPDYRRRAFSQGLIRNGPVSWNHRAKRCRPEILSGHVSDRRLVDRMGVLLILTDHCLDMEAGCRHRVRPVETFFVPQTCTRQNRRDGTPPTRQAIIFTVSSRQSIGRNPGHAERPARSHGAHHGTRSSSPIRPRGTVLIPTMFISGEVVGEHVQRPLRRHYWAASS